MYAGESDETGDAPEIGAESLLLAWACPGLPPAPPGAPVISGNSDPALPALMSWLDTLLRLGMGPSGTPLRPATFTGVSAGVLDDGDADLVAGAEAAVTDVVPAAAGAVHLAVVVTLAVAVSFTDVTEVAFDATATLAVRLTACLSVTEAMTHDAAPFPLAHPALNVGFRLAGWAASVTVTSDAVPSFADTFTAYVAVWPRLILDWERCTLTHS